MSRCYELYKRFPIQMFCNKTKEWILLFVSEMEIDNGESSTG